MLTIATQHIKSRQAAPETHDAASLDMVSVFAKKITQDLKSAGYNCADGDSVSAFATTIKDIVCIDKDTLFFRRTDDTPHFENYSRLFTLKDAYNEEHYFVLRNGKGMPQIELVLLEKFAAIESGKAIATYVNITLNDLRKAISG